MSNLLTQVATCLSQNTNVLVEVCKDCHQKNIRFDLNYLQSFEAEVNILKDA